MCGLKFSKEGETKSCYLKPIQAFILKIFEEKGQKSKIHGVCVHLENGTGENKYILQNQKKCPAESDQQST